MTATTLKAGGKCGPFAWPAPNAEIIAAAAEVRQLVAEFSRALRAADIASTDPSYETPWHLAAEADTISDGQGAAMRRLAAMPSMTAAGVRAKATALSAFYGGHTPEPEAPCGELLASLPADKRAELDRMRDRRTAGAATTPTIGGMASWLGGVAHIPWLSGLGEYLTSQGDAKPGAGGAALTTRQRAAMKFFEGTGLTVAQAAGPTANIQEESAFNPFIVGDGGKAYGLGQWHPDRQADYAKMFGHTMQSVTDLQQAMQEQLEFYQHELAGGGDAGARKAGILLRGAQTGREAGAIVSRFDERPRAVADAARSRGDLAEVTARSPDNGGKVQVDTHIRITNDGTPQMTSRATASGNAAASSPKISMPLVPAG